MSKNIIFAGKELNENSKLPVITKQEQINAFITTSLNDRETEKTSPAITDWNRSSPVSAKTLVVNAENQLKQIDGAVLFFDAPCFNRLFTHNSIEEFNRASDELVLSYTYLAFEILKRFEKKNQGKLFFVLQNMQTQAEFMRKTPHDQIANTECCTNITAMAQSAFITFAENLVATKYKASNVNYIYLLEALPSVSEQQIVRWISQKMDEDYPVYKTSKQTVTWQSVESKSKFSLSFGK